VKCFGHFQADVAATDDQRRLRFPVLGGREGVGIADGVQQMHVVVGPQVRQSVDGWADRGGTGAHDQRVVLEAAFTAGWGVRRDRAMCDVEVAGGVFQVQQQAGRLATRSPVAPRARSGG